MANVGNQRAFAEMQRSLKKKRVREREGERQHKGAVWWKNARQTKATRSRMGGRVRRPEVRQEIMVGCMDILASEVCVHFTHMLWRRLKLFNRPGRRFIRPCFGRNNKNNKHLEKSGAQSRLNQLKCSTFTVGDGAAQTRFLRLPA